MKSICREHGKVVVWFVSLGFLFCLGLFWFFFFHSRVQILRLQHALQDTSLQQAILVSLLRLREFGDR